MIEYELSTARLDLLAGAPYGSVSLNYVVDSNDSNLIRRSLVILEAIAALGLAIN